MKYNGFYFWLFSPTMEKVLTEHYGARYAKEIMKKSKPLYRSLVEKADDIGDGNPMAFNELFALAFAAPYLASEKKIPPETIQEMMRRSLYHVKWYFTMVNLNTEKGKAANKKQVVQYVKWYTPDKEKQYPTSFKVDFVGQPYEGACYYRITRCPICAYTKKLGVEELMPLLCELDAVMVNLQHGVLHRAQTIASGGDYCDYWIVGDRETAAQQTNQEGNAADLNSGSRQAMGFFENTRKPEGFGGKLMVKMMNSGHGKLVQWGHGKLARWGFSKLSVRPDCEALDVGCGGGANLANWLSKCGNGHVTGLDYSEVSVAEAGKLNADAIKQGKCKVVQGDVSSMPFADRSFDYVSAFETIYFWPDLEKCFAEVHRVLKSGGIFVICNEYDGAHASDEKWVKIINGMKIYDKGQICGALRKAGFSEAEIYSNPKRHWLCVVAKK